MTTIICAENIKVLQLSSPDIDDRVIHTSELRLIKSDKTGSYYMTAMPAHVYKWCLKNDCKYIKAAFMDTRKGKGSIPYDVLLFNTAEACKKFRVRWLDTVVQFDDRQDYDKRMTSFNYPFVSKAMDNEWAWQPKIKFNRAAYDWLRCNHIKIVKNSIDMNIGHYLVFDTPEDAMAFTLAWL